MASNPILSAIQAFFTSHAGSPWPSFGMGREKEYLRVRTLVMLRWLAIAGQTAMVLFVALALKFEVRIWWCTAIIMASVWLNLVLSLSPRRSPRLKGWEAAIQLSFDAIQLALLLGVTGGLNNPFCLMLIAPATVAAANLPTRHGLFVVFVAMMSALALAFWHLELPWFAGEAFDLPDMYRFGLLTAILIGMAFTAGYSWQAALESARMEQALSATQAVLEKEHRLSALGGLAAAAAHELGTPLGTIQVVAKEMLHSLKPDDPLREDAELLVSQSQRCRDILRQLSQKPETRDKVYEQLALSDFLELIAGPYRVAGKAIHITVIAQEAAEGSDPGQLIQVRRRPEWLHALSAFVENAVDFARTAVWVRVEITKTYVRLTIEDDGPGFSADILSRLGEPYITSREFFDDAPKASGRSYSGMGLGFFIAKTLCEHTGATVTYGNREQGGALVTLLWRREEMDISYDD